MKREEIAIIGLGYVGLPLAIEFGKVYQTIGFDTNKSRVDELHSGTDTTREVTLEELKESSNLSYTNNEEEKEVLAVQSKFLYGGLTIESKSIGIVW